MKHWTAFCTQLQCTANTIPVGACGGQIAGRSGHANATLGVKNEFFNQHFLVTMRLESSNAGAWGERKVLQRVETFDGEENMKFAQERS